MVPSLVLSYQVHLVFPVNPITAVRVLGVLATSVEKVEHQVLPSVGAVLVASNVAWKNEAITISSFHLNTWKFPTVAIVVVPALRATLFGIFLSVVPSTPVPPLHLPTVVAYSQITKPSASATVAVFVVALVVSYGTKLIPS